MVLFSFFLLTGIVCAQSTCAQAADSVKLVVESLFRAMKQADSVSLKSLFTENAQLQTIVVQKDGSVSIRNEALGNFISMVGRLPAGDADERIRFDAVHVDGDLASVWTPYQFFYKGSFSHCGVNSFQLVRTKGVWKIHFLIDTRRKAGCD